jgi:4-hydroxy-tetrahydrodipicolinate synthase
MPFDGGLRIDEEDLRREVDWAIDCGVDGVCIAVASEVYKFTEAERDLILKTVVDQVNGRVRVVMNTGAEGTDVAVHYSRRAEELGADALMIRPPTYVDCNVEETAQYFLTIADRVGLPIFVQDQTPAPVVPALAVRLARERENLCYYKTEARPTVPRLAEAANLRGDSGLIIFGGMGGVFLLEEARRGAVGTMPACTMPDVFVRIWRTWCSGDREGAERDFHRYAALLRTMEQGIGPAAWMYKHILKRRGIFKSSATRRPAIPPDHEQYAELDQLLEEVGQLAG